jgi:putative ABC transport system permease protein
MIQDVRYALRLLIKSPAYTSAAAATLALGIGANIAIFTVAWQLILKPLPYPDPSRIVQVWESVGPQSTNPVTPGNYHDWRGASSFDALAAYTHLRGAIDLTGSGEPEQLRVRYVTGEYFRVFGMPPLAGRGIDEQDLRDDGRVVVLSEQLWRRRFGARDAVQQTIRLGDAPYTVVGVMPASFQAAGGEVDAWLGMSIPPDPAGRQRAHYLGVVGRLTPGVSVAQADDEVKRIAANAARLYPDTNARLSASVRSIQSERAPTFRSTLVILASAAALVLLIACANLASLQFARSVARSREFGIRAAVGATRGRLIRQLVTESLLVSLAGAAAGLVTGTWSLRVIGFIAPSAVGPAADARPDTAVVAVALALAFIGAVLSGLAPAWRATAGATRALWLRGDGSDAGTSRIRLTLVAVQISLAIVLMIAATVLISSLARVLRVDPGFDPSGVIAFDLSMTRYDSHQQRAALFDRVSGELRALPGVTAVCSINEVPFDAEGRMTYVPEGQVRPVGAQPRTISPECFDVLRLRLLSGRRFDAHEPNRVAIVSRRFAQAAWPGQDPLGRRAHLGTVKGVLLEVVGVVDDLLQDALDGPRAAQVYEPAGAEAAFPTRRVMFRTSGPADALLPSVPAAVRRADPLQPVARLRTLDNLMGASVSGRRFQLVLLTAFAIVALVLAAVGIYGLLSQVVAQRRSEIGIRLALGAAPSSVVRLVMRSAWIAVGIGTAAGLAAALAASVLLRRFVFGVSPTDPALYLGTTVFLLAVALAAAWLPARRAARIEAIDALRG